MTILDTIKAGLGNLVVQVENVNFSQLAEVLTVAQESAPLVEQGIVAVESLVSTTKAALTGQAMSDDEWNAMIADIKGNSAALDDAAAKAQAELDAEADPASPAA